MHLRVNRERGRGRGGLRKRFHGGGVKDGEEKNGTRGLRARGRREVIDAPERRGRTEGKKKEGDSLETPW